MKITKFVHSCLLVEWSRQAVLIDPGNYSWDSHILTVNKLPRLNYIVVTHEHPDHYYLPALRALRQKFPHAPIVTNNHLATKMPEEGVGGPFITGSEENLQVFEAPHEPPAWGLPTPLNIGVHVADYLTHPGDALQIQHSRDVLALPITAPFASLKESLDRITDIKPKIVIPLHDWPWHKKAREEYYEQTKKYLETKNIRFLPIENGITTEI
jgi:L-ascorbate metabolism protein UlaG (beta-lactamase superfamily)